MVREGQEQINALSEQVAHASGLATENEILFNDKESMRRQIQAL